MNVTKKDYCRFDLDKAHNKVSWLEQWSIRVNKELLNMVIVMHCGRRACMRKIEGLMNCSVFSRK